MDYKGLTPVRYTKLNHSGVRGLCVSGSWLVVTYGWANTTRLFSLPDLTLHHQVTVERCLYPRADSDGLVYVSAKKHIAVLEITDSGNMTAVRNITAVGGQILNSPRVAVGPQPGQLCVSSVGPFRLWLVNATNDRVVQTLTPPEQCRGLYSVASLDSGQLMISYGGGSPWKFSLAVYRSTSESPTVLTSLSVADFVYGLVGSGNKFLAPYVNTGGLLVVSANGTVLHTVDAVSGKLGIFLYFINDVAVWQDCIWLGGFRGDFVVLCAD